jgi:hypothetical protein
VNIFFDVDYTLQGDDGSLRPGARELLERLHAEGHAIYVWSGRGIRIREVRRHGLDDIVAGVYEKPLYRHRERLELLGVPVVPDFVVDDHEEVVEVFGGYTVVPYYGMRFPFGGPDAEGDTEMDRVAEAIAQLWS